MGLTWANETRKLRDLQPQEDNPRQIRKAQAERLVKSFDQFNQVETIACNPDGTILNGHQRYFVLLAAYDADYEVDVRIPSRPLSRAEWQKLTVYLHKGAAGEWNWDALAEWEGVDVEDLLDWGFDEQALLGGGFDIESDEPAAHTIGRSGRLYTERDIDPYKLAYRVEAAWKSKEGKALDLFSGQGQLRGWYRRRFARVVTVDKNKDCDVDYTMSVLDFIKAHLTEHLDFDFVDFDDEGCPGIEIQSFFTAIQGKKKDSFVLALTDGNGLNLKLRGKFNPAVYMQSGNVRKAIPADYEQFEQTVVDFVIRVALESGFTATSISTCRGSQGNVVYQTWLIAAQVA